MTFPIHRPRRLRMHPIVRDLVRETQVQLSKLIHPIFVRHGNQSFPVESMPGYFQFCLADLKKEMDEVVSLGIKSIMLFGIPEHKDEHGSASYRDDGIIQQAIKIIKENYPDILITVDVCFCEYTSHAHCGVMNSKTGRVDLDNDETLVLLAKQAVSYAQAGADMIVPSGMIDGAVRTIRVALDEAHFSHLPILSHSSKYATSLYGPFRHAAESVIQFGDRKTYQMDVANADEAIKEVQMDIEEGADIVLIKPALPFLDVIYRIKQCFPEIPVAAYQVSGEYSMIKAVSQRGWLDETKVMLETLTAIKRAGASIIVTYFAKEFAKLDSA